MASGDTRILELRAERVPVGTLLRDLVRHADLLPLLAQQHFRGRFRAARLGVAWSAIQPLLRGAVLAVVFTQFVQIPVRSGVPYPAFIFAGTAIWSYLSAAITMGTTSITSSAELAGKVYFPRLLLPAMPAASTLPSLVVTLALVVLLTFAFGVEPALTLLTLPLSVGLGFVLVTAAAAVLALLHVYFRDVGPLVEAGMGILFYATPIVYPADLAEQYAWILEINPFTGAVSAVRWSLFGGREDLGNGLWWTAGWIVVLVVSALVAYRRHERICVDRL